MLKSEFHSHTNHIQTWSEGNYSPDKLIDRAALLGFDVLCITEHYSTFKNWPDYRKDPLKTYRDYKEYAKKKGILLIPGTEVWFEEGEVLLINFRGDARKLKKIMDLRKLPKNVLKIASHPFYGRKMCMGHKIIKYRDLLDGWEYCHFYYGWLNPNKKAVALAEKFGKKMIGTSDVHRLYQLNRTFTLVDAKKDANAIVDAIRKGKHKAITNQLPFSLFVWMFIVAGLGGIALSLYLDIDGFIRKKIF